MIGRTGCSGLCKDFLLKNSESNTLLLKTEAIHRSEEVDPMIDFGNTRDIITLELGGIGYGQERVTFLHHFRHSTLNES